RYEIGLFVSGRVQAVAQGHFVHVYVDRDSQQPVELSDALRGVLAGLAPAGE
ncbi:MAG: acyl-CoA thioesterase, partial [Gammaproteobacteria bacterium]